MKLSFKRFMKNAFILVGLVLLAASCSTEADLHISEKKYEYEVPEFVKGDLNYLSFSDNGTYEMDYYCFTSANAGDIVVNVHSNRNTDYALARAPFTYENGEFVIGGTKRLYAMIKDEFIEIFSKENCYTRPDGKKGLFGKFTMGDNELNFSKSGEVEFNGNGESFTVKFKNTNGVVSIYDSHSSIEFYFLEDGSLLPRKALSDMRKEEKITMNVTMDTKEEKGVALCEFMKTLPDGFFYEMKNINRGGYADLVTVKTLLVDNPDKKFSFTPGMNGMYYLNATRPDHLVPDYYFKDCKNLYGFTFGNLLGENYKLGTGAFMNCTNLTTIMDCGSVYDFGESCFEGCTELTRFIISGVRSDYTKNTYIRPNAFKGCTKITAEIGSAYKSVKVKKEGVDETEIFDTEIKGQEDNFTSLLTDKYVDYEWTLTK